MSIIKVDFGDAPSITSAPELLWTNPSPTSNFAAQTINESSTGWVSGRHISDYDGFLVMAMYDSVHPGKNICYIPMTDPTFVTNFATGRYYATDAANSNSAGQGRKITISSSGFEVNNPNGANYAIPLYVWGVKGQLSVD